MLNRKSKKTTIHELQQLCGFLNFLGRAVVPGRAFTRRLYSFTHNANLNPHHHVRIGQEMRLDLAMWQLFLHHHLALARPFLDFSRGGCFNAESLDMYSDSAENHSLGMGATCEQSWVFTKWNKEFCDAVNPSTEYLELFAVVTGVLLWIHRFRNKRIILYCANRSVVDMINNTSSACKNCMVLIRILVLKGLTENVRIFAAHVIGKSNYFCDALSRMKISTFWELSKKHNKNFEETPHDMPDDIWPMQKIWLY